MDSFEPLQVNLPFADAWLRCPTCMDAAQHGSMWTVISSREGMIPHFEEGLSETDLRGTGCSLHIAAVKHERDRVWMDVLCEQGHRFDLFLRHHLNGGLWLSFQRVRPEDNQMWIYDPRQ